MEIQIGDDIYPFDLNELRNDEADALERALGYSFKEFSERLEAGWSSALTAYVWIMRRRSDPSVRLAEVKFVLSGLNMLYSDDEARQAFTGLEDPKDRAQFLGSLPDDQRERLGTVEVASDPLDSTDNEAESPELTSEPVT